MGVGCGCGFGGVCVVGVGVGVAVPTTPTGLRMDGLCGDGVIGAVVRGALGFLGVGVVEPTDVPDDVGRGLAVVPAPDEGGRVVPDDVGRGLVDVGGVVPRLLRKGVPVRLLLPLP